MDDGHRNRKQQHRKGQSLQFTFVGGTPERLSKEQIQPKFVPDLTQHQLEEEPVFPLSHTQIGDFVVITQIISGKSLIYRLSQMGLIIGSEIQVISKTKSGSVIVGIQDQQVGLGAGMANQVMVTFAIERKYQVQSFELPNSNQIQKLGSRTMDWRNRNKRQHRHRSGEVERQGETENLPQKRSLMTLAKANTGDRLWIAGYESKDGIERLVGMGLAPGMGIQVVKNLAGNLVVAVGETRIGLDGGMAKRILVSDRPFDYLVEVQEVNDMEGSATTLRDLQVNQKGKVTRYESTDDHTKKAYKKKLLAMGLTPGTEFTVTRVAPLGDPVEILVRGFKLSLRKDEAAALVIEELP